MDLRDYPVPKDEQQLFLDEGVMRTDEGVQSGRGVPIGGKFQIPILNFGSSSAQPFLCFTVDKWGR
jgi:hypothetical protein